MLVQTGVSRKLLTVCGYFLVGCSLIGLMLTGINVHDWRETVGLIYLTAFMIGVLFLIRARFRQQ